MNIGFLSCHESEYFPQFQTFAFESEQSLLDFDLVLWHLEFLHFGYELSFGHQCQDLQRLLDDRERRLEEIERFLTQGKSLVILLSDPVTILGDLREYLQGLIGSLDYNDLTQELMHRAVEVNERVQVTLNQVFGEARGPEHTFDIYSFLLEHVEELLRKHAVPVKKRSNEIDFHGDSAFLGFWESIKGVAWYDVFFSAPIGTPLLYKADTQYPVAVWLKRSNGNIFLIPNTEYDSSDDYPMLVEATRELMVAVDDLTGNQVDRQWRAGEHRSDDVRISSWLHYVDPARIEELRSLSAERFDLTKLIRLCEELNACYVQGCFFAVAMLTRAIIDHVPPVFGYRTFVEVANNYGSRTFKKSMHNLQTSLRNVADSHLHLPIRRRESLPTRVQVDFSSDLDVLLAEVVRILK